MGTYGVIDFDDEEIEAASHWYGGQGSMLYAITSTGALSRGTIRPRHPEGGLLTDEEWIVDLAERLKGEAEQSARDAAKQAKKAKGDEKKELLADREGLLSIAYKEGQFVRGRRAEAETLGDLDESCGKETLDKEVAHPARSRDRRNPRRSTHQHVQARPPLQRVDGRNGRSTLRRDVRGSFWSHHHTRRAGSLPAARSTTLGALMNHDYYQSQVPPKSV